MFLIVGLGNPGDKYKNNRHNVGFLYLDFLREKYNTNEFKKKKNFFYSISKSDIDDFVMIKPKTFMNLSGKAVVSAMSFFKIKPEKILIIYDDIALPFGKIRIRERGSDGGHNGLKSIEQNLGRSDYMRIRIGIGAPEFSSGLVNHVLSDFSSDNIDDLNKNIFNCCEESTKLILKNNIKEAMNKFNGTNCI